MHWGALPEDMLHFLCVVQSRKEIDIVLCGSSLPQHDTSKYIRIHIHVCLDQRLYLVRGDIESRPGSALGGWQTNEKFRFRILGILDEIDPIIKVEMTGVSHKVPRRTTPGVVKLDPNEVKFGVVDSVVEL